MTVEAYKKELNTLHDAIKDNPFRRDYEVYAKYGPGYFKTVYKFAETFYHLIKSIQRNELPDVTESDKKLAKVITLDFIHDFYAACNLSSTAISMHLYNGEQKYMDRILKKEEYLELCISFIHGYLETGEFLRYPTLRKEEIVWAEWNPEQGKYGYPGEMTMEEAKRAQELLSASSGRTIDQIRGM